MKLKNLVAHETGYNLNISLGITKFQHNFEVSADKTNSSVDANTDHIVCKESRLL